MNIRFSIGSRWIEFYLFYRLMLDNWLLLNIQYGHNSTRNFIYLRRDNDGRTLFKWRNRKARWLRRG